MQHAQMIPDYDSGPPLSQFWHHTDDGPSAAAGLPPSAMSCLQTLAVSTEDLTSGNTTTKLADILERYSSLKTLHISGENFGLVQLYATQDSTSRASATLVIREPAQQLRHITLFNMNSELALSILRLTPRLENLTLFGIDVDAPSTASFDLCLAHLRRLELFSDLESPSSDALNSNPFPMLRVVVLANPFVHAMRMLAQKNNIVFLQVRSYGLRLSTTKTECFRRHPTRNEERERLVALLQSCTHLAHLQLGGFHTADLSIIFGAISRPLASLAVELLTCGTELTPRFMNNYLIAGHKTLSQLRFLSVPLIGGVVGADRKALYTTCVQRRICLTHLSDLETILKQAGKLDAIYRG